MQDRAGPQIELGKLLAMAQANRPLTGPLPLRDTRGLGRRGPGTLTEHAAEQMISVVTVETAERSA